MKGHQRGTATLDAVISVSFAVGMFLLGWQALFVPAKRISQAYALETKVDEVAYAARRFYGAEVLKTGCLTARTSPTIKKLIQQHYLDSSINHNDYQFTLAYHHTKTMSSAHSTWTRPVRVQVTVNFRDTQQMQDLLAYLSPTQARANIMTFEHAMPFNAAHSLNELNNTTGCFQ